MATCEELETFCSSKSYDVFLEASKDVLIDKLYMIISLLEERNDVNFSFTEEQHFENGKTFKVEVNYCERN